MEEVHEEEIESGVGEREEEEDEIEEVVEEEVVVTSSDEDEDAEEIFNSGNKYRTSTLNLIICQTCRKFS